MKEELPRKPGPGEKSLSARLYGLADLGQHLCVLRPGQAVNGGARFSQDAVDERAFLHHDFEGFPLAERIEQARIHRLAAPKRDAGGEGISAPVADAANDEMLRR